jgi:predicted Zn-dependent protease
MGSQAAQLLFLSYGRDDERESDDVGVEYAAKGGYEAAEGAEFFSSLKRMSESSGQSIPSFLSTHPDPGEREQTIVRLAQEWESTTNMTKLERDAYLNQVDGIVLGENPRQGFTENGVFYHPDLKFRFPVPDGFQVINQPTQVAMVDENQQAILLFTIESESNTAQAAAQSFAGQEGLTVIERSAASSNGLPAYFVVADAQLQDGQTVRVKAYYVEYGGNVYAFIGYAAQQNYANYSGQLTNTMSGFAPLRDNRILSIQPTRLAVRPASQNAPFNTFLSSNLPRNMTENDMAILNQVGLDQTIERGTRLKLVQ